MIQYDITVKGRVQGVGFRHFALQQARLFNLKGWIENSANGNVQLRVQGEKAEADTFVDYLRIGSTRSNVSSVLISSSEISEPISGFTIRG